MSRSRILIASLAFAIALADLSWIGLAPRSGHTALAVEVANLKQQLESELRARRPTEFAFIEDIVRMVEQDQLPLALVRSTFHWARSQRPYPFQYFRRGIIFRARQVGIVIESQEGL